MRLKKYGTLPPSRANKSSAGVPNTSVCADGGPLPLLPFDPLLLPVLAGEEVVLTTADGGDSEVVTLSSEPLRPARGEIEAMSS